jgi:regulator of sirC expression with transglutaminase-like and TPR domain
MDYKLQLPSALDYFTSLVQSDDDFPLLETAVSLAQDEFPKMDIQQVLDEVDVLAARLKRRVMPNADALDKLRELNSFFFDDMRFAGNVNHYDDPHNSFINVVLSKRLGIPISLAVLWLELGLSLGLKVHGVSFPGHFLVKLDLVYPHEGHVVIDPFTGESLSREDLAERLIPWLPGAKLGKPQAISDDALAFHLEPAEPRQIIARMLRNLHEIYRRLDDQERLLKVRARLALLFPEN